jgi:hypothetical protein
LGFFYYFLALCHFCNLHFEFHLETNLASSKLIFRLHSREELAIFGGWLAGWLASKAGIVEKQVLVNDAMHWHQYQWVTDS